VEIFAHLTVRDWGQFLELQGLLMLQIMEVIETVGARLAIPAQTAYLAISSGTVQSSVQALLDTSGPRGPRQNRDAT
jgi:hypothetical protein